ncbi:hypothetical protein [Streptomyces alboflavus]|uniref:hypothetical protein n=1 Tax=Streptomyces alboflavus TaxID=67267 RepID=UPI000F656FFE|nr:hypothetical protein [Streptomyces alboflavus]
MNQPNQARYTTTLPDGSLLTFDHMQADDLVQVYVGSWPHDTEFAVVLQVRERVLCRLEKGGQTHWVPRHRIAGLMRQVPEPASLRQDGT